MKKLVYHLMIFVAMTYSVWGEIPTFESVTRLYVATFDRAPDKAGLDYWLHDSFGGHPTLENIAASFFDQPETQRKYPPGTSTREFIRTVYRNLFNRDPDEKGWEYWEDMLTGGNDHGYNPSHGVIPKNLFILAVINGALAPTGDPNDAAILSNKTEVGLAFADAGLNDVALAKEVMAGVGADAESVQRALESVESHSLYFVPDDPMEQRRAYDGKYPGMLANYYAYAALKSDGTVVTWGDPNGGGESSAVAESLRDVKAVYSNMKAFAALKKDGTVVAWGDPTCGGDTSYVMNDLTGIKAVYATQEAFAALKRDGTVVTWGNTESGGDSSVVSDRLNNVIEISS